MDGRPAERWQRHGGLGALYIGLMVGSPLWLSVLVGVTDAPEPEQVALALGGAALGGVVAAAVVRRYRVRIEGDSLEIRRLFDSRTLRRTAIESVEATVVGVWAVVEIRVEFGGVIPWRGMSSISSAAARRLRDELVERLDISDHGTS